MIMVVLIAQQIVMRVTTYIAHNALHLSSELSDLEINIVAHINTDKSSNKDKLAALRLCRRKYFSRKIIH